MTTLPSKPCEEMTVDDFIQSWKSFLEALKKEGHDWIEKRGGGLAMHLHEMWELVLQILLDRLEEFRKIAEDIEDREMLCRIIWGVGAWDPEGPFGGISDEAPDRFTTARMIKEAVERWLGSQLSDSTNDLLKALNQLLCMLQCL